MTATLIGGRQESLDHCDGLLVGDKTTWHGENVGIVVLTGKAGYSKTLAKG